ncbi:MAG: FAD-dependent oxidoreductase, partial [Parvularculaceae bacterium]|nr:FAD-dependent oxidoreductase [Parvularculaceae bacterium]
MPQKRVAIVGAGIAGLTAAAVLSRSAQVDIYERDDRPGGKVRQVRWGNRAIDCGPTVFTLREVFDDIFQACGEEIDDHIQLQPLDVLARHAWPDGSRLDLYADKEKTAEAISAFAGPREADAYLDFLRMAGTTWDTVYEPFVKQAKPSLLNMIMKVPPKRLFRRDPYLTMWQELSVRFKDERLRQLFGRYTTYCGASPFKAPATLALIAHIEQEGVWTVRGGMASLAAALVRVAEARGARFHYGASIQEMSISGGRVSGLAEHGDADLVLYNGDGAALANDGAITQGKNDPASLSPSGRTQSAVTMSFLGQTEGFEPAVHNVLFSNDYRAEFDDVFDRHRVPQQPTVYLFAPDAEGPDIDDKRHFCLINAPAHGDTHTYTEEDERLCQNKIMAQAKACGLNLKP